MLVLIFINIERYLKKEKILVIDEYKKLIVDLKKLPDLVKETLSKQNDIQIMARDFISAKGTMYLGRGYSYPIAMEGALKLKELIIYTCRGLCSRRNEAWTS